MKFNQGYRNLKIRENICFGLLTAIAAMVFLASGIFGQESLKAESLVKTSDTAVFPNAEVDGILPPGEMTQKTIRVARSVKNLREYVKRLYPQVSGETIEDVLVDNNPAVRFDVVQSNRRIEMILVANAGNLTLYQMMREAVSDKMTVEETTTKTNAETTADVAGCGGLYSVGNPYPCCSNGGNCTWFAWYRANVVFNAVSSGNGFTTSNFGNAKNWASAARSHGYPVSSESGSRTVGVNSTMSAEGHVFFVEIQKWKNLLIASEMQCYNYYGPKWSVQYDRSRANLGYIYPKSKSWRPRVSMVVSPTIWAGTNPVWIMFSGSNFTTDTIVDVVTPDGSTVSLSGTQLSRSSSTALWAQIVFNQRGYWKFKVVGKDGQRSDWVYVWVN